MLPQHLVVEFWADVKARLQEDYGLDEQTAQQYITLYCERMQLHGGFDMVYHENPADVAKGLSHGGILLPDAAPDERRRALLENYPALTDFFVADHDN